MMKIWGRKNSMNVQKVMWTVGELGLVHERIDAGRGFGKNDTLEYRRMNPNGLIPVLEDGDLVLWESNVIVRYLAARYGEGSLWQTDPAARALSDKWMDWLVTTIMPDVSPLIVGLIRTSPEKRNVQEIEAARLKLTKSMGIFEAQLAGRDYVAGKTLTLGDIAMGVAVQRWFGLPMERPSLPNTEAYFHRLSKRPAFAEHVAFPLT